MQTAIVMIIIGLSVIYLAAQAVKSLRGKKGRGNCSGCGKE